MRALSKHLRSSFSFNLRSPINIDLLKTEEGRKSIEQGLKARFKDEKFLNNLTNSY